MIPLLAVSDGVWLGIIGLLALFIKEFFDQRRADKAAAKIEQIHVATNSMKDELVNEVRQASFAAGEKSEADKTDGVATQRTAVGTDESLKKAIDKVPERTATKVVEKLKEDEEK